MIKIISRTLVPVLIFLLFPWGCSERPEEGLSTPVIEETPVTLNIGLIPEQNVFDQLERYQPIADYLTKRVGANTELKVLTRYGNIIDNFTAMNLDGAFFGSFTYTLAHEKIGVEVIARPETTSGESTYHGLIFTRKDSGIRSAADMAGKIFAFVDQATTAGFIFPLAYFKENDVDDYRSYFKETYYAGTHEYAIYDVLNKKADVGAAKNTIYEMFSSKDPRLGAEMVVLARSLDVPENGFAVRKDLDESMRKKLREVLLNMHLDAEGEAILNTFGAKRFIPTQLEDYANVVSLVQKIGLELKTYDYMND